MIQRRAGSDKRTDQLCFNRDRSLLYPFLPVPPQFFPNPFPLHVPSSLFTVTPTPVSILDPHVQRLTLCQRLLLSNLGNRLFYGHKAYMWVVGSS